MSNPSHAVPGEKELMKLGSLNPTRSNSSEHALVKTKGGGMGGARKTQDDRARSAQDQAAKDDDCTPEMAKANTPGGETAAVKPKASLKRVGWMAEKTAFKSDAQVFAEFDVPSAIGDKTLVEFELFRKVNGEFKAIKKIQAHADASGRAQAVLPIPESEEPKATFAIKVKHCSAEWSSGQGTERDVSETAVISIEHTQVSGIHFSKGKSFIADIYLDTLCEMKKTYLEWKKAHAKAQIVVYGHTEQDEQENPIVLGRNRAMSAFLFIIGDAVLWAELAEKERWGVWEQQCMLRALGFFKAKPTGNLGPITRKAIQDFIAFLNEARCKNINPMLGLSEAYIRKELYREYINVKRSGFELPSSAFRLVSGNPYVGCCSYNRYKSGQELHDENRRIVFVILQESPNFPAMFPCRSSTAAPCDMESKKAGDRAIKGFACKFYDEMVKVEKAGAVEKLEAPHAAIVKFSKGLDLERQKILSAKSIELIGKAANAAGLESVMITSTVRYPHQQADAMYTNLSNGKRLSYAAPGEAVTAVYDKCHKEGLDKPKTIEKMVEKINALSKEGNRVSKHCVSAEVYGRTNIVDIGIPSKNVKEFIIELAKDVGVEKIFHDIKAIPDSGKIARLAKEPCIHVEIKQ